MQKIIIFQQNGSGAAKLDGIRHFGGSNIQVDTFDIDLPLPHVLDDTSDILPSSIEADLVLDFLKHQDLSHDLSVLCKTLDIPLVASGKKDATGNAICPPV